MPNPPERNCEKVLVEKYLKAKSGNYPDIIDLPHGQLVQQAFSARDIGASPLLVEYLAHPENYPSGLLRVGVYAFNKNGQIGEMVSEHYPLNYQPSIQAVNSLLINPNIQKTREEEALIKKAVEEGSLLPLVLATSRFLEAVNTMCENCPVGKDGLCHPRLASTFNPNNRLKLLNITIRQNLTAGFLPLPSVITTPA
jgi:hypothetical protein